MQKPKSLLEQNDATSPATGPVKVRTFGPLANAATQVKKPKPPTLTSGPKKQPKLSEKKIEARPTQVKPD